MREIRQADHHSAAAVEWAHPETRSSETFLINMSSIQFDAFTWTSKRMGSVAYDGEGHRQTAPDWHPVFVARSELDSQATTLSAIRRILWARSSSKAAA